MAKNAGPRDPHPPGGTERRFPMRNSPLVGNHPFALEYAMLEYILQGFTATAISRKLKEAFPEFPPYFFNTGTVQHYLKRALANQIVQIKPPRSPDLEKYLKEIYSSQYNKNITFCVADDSIGFVKNRSMTSFFWNLAAEVIDDTIGALLEAEDQPKDREIVVGNTGGVSASEAIKHLSRITFDPTHLDKGRNRLCFLSLTAVGSAERFDLHANYLAALLGNIYGGRHMAVMDRAQEQPPSVGEKYRSRLKNMQMIIGGLGTASGDLGKWFDEHKVKKPRGMIGDIFFHPIGEDGRILDLDEETKRSLEPLQLNPTEKDLWHFLGQAHRHRSLIIVTEPMMGNTRIEKHIVLDRVLRAGYVTDCVLGSDLATRLRSLHLVTPKKPAASGPSKAT